MISYMSTLCYLVQEFLIAVIPETSILALQNDNRPSKMETPTA